MVHDSGPRPGQYQAEEPMQSVIKIPEELAHELDLLAQAEHKGRTPYVVDLLLAGCPT